MSISLLLGLGAPHSSVGNIQEETETEVKTNHHQYVQERKGFLPKKRNVAYNKQFGVYNSPFQNALNSLVNVNSAYLLYQQWLFYG